MSTPTITSKETMTAGFPPIIQSISGTPTLGDLFRAYRHLMYCAQSQFTAFHPLNWLFLVVPPNMWDMHSTEAHPAPPANPGAAPNYGIIGTPLDIINAKDTYNTANKNFQEDANMNRALTERFLSLFATEHAQAYYNLLLADPGRRFGTTFTYFYELFGTRDEREIEVNRDSMKAPWNPQSGFQALKARFMDAIAVAAFADSPISPSDVLNMLLAVILATGVFQLEYTEWHALPTAQHTILIAWDWWAKKVLMRLKFQKVAGNMNRGMEYGNSAVAGSNEELDGVIEDFAQGHAATQSTIQNLSQGFPELRAQMQQQCNMIAQLQQQLAFSTQQTQQGSGNWSNNNNNNSNSNRGNSNNNRGRTNNNNGNRSGGNNRNRGSNTSWNRGGNSTNNGGNSNSNVAAPVRFKFNRTAFPADTRTNEEIFYCYTHGWDRGHNSNSCGSPCPHHNSTAATHVGTNGNPRFSERTVAPSSRGLIGYVQAKAMTTGATCAVQQPRAPAWQANSMRMTPAMMAPAVQQPMMAPVQMQAQSQPQQQMMTQPAQPMMQQQPQQLWAMSANGNMVPYQPNNGNMNGNGMGMGGNNAGPFF
jgi:hypothetical protein